VLSQIGGTLTRSQPDGPRANVLSAKAEHNPLMQVGDEEIVFLSQDSATGKYFTTGGGLGRFKVQSNGSVIAVDHDSPLGRLHSGRSANQLKPAVQSVSVLLGQLQQLVGELREGFRRLEVLVGP